MKIKKILLISPTYTKPGLISKFLRFVPINLAALMSAAPQYSYTVVDENIKGLDFEHDLEGVSLVGITVMTVQAPRAYELTDKIRALGILVVLGGSHVSFLSEEAIEHADAVVIGEAELVWPKLLKDLENDQLQRFYKSDRVADLSKLSPVQRTPLLKKYKYLFPNTLYVTRGCPNDCNFCSVPRLFGKKYRIRPVPQVIKGNQRNERRKLCEPMEKSIKQHIMERHGKTDFCLHRR